jgi:signal transduction histidine kinase/CheY-like chemotaxis protein
MPELQHLVGTLRLKIGQQGISGWVAAHGEPLNVPDVRNDSRYSFASTEELRTRSELAVPIILKGGVTGVLDVQSDKAGAYSELDVFTLQTVADQLAVAIENARLYDQLQRELVRRKGMEGLLRDLHDAGLAMQRAATPEEVFETARKSLGNSGMEVSIHGGPDEEGAPDPYVIQRIREGEPAVVVPGAIVAALRTEGRFLGFVTVRGPGLGADHVPALLGFAGQVAAARRTAELLRELETSLGELHRTQEQLLQSQKMEAVGRLAGGVAHDFNNQLTAINGYAELLLEEVPLGDPRRSFVTEIISASRRAAGLTRQLLAFSRKQVLQPRAVDLVALVQGLRTMLERIIGENIALETSFGGAPVIVRADPAQLEHVLVNLVLNARDAMPSGGTLTIAAHHSSGIRGGDSGAARCVLSVSDTGVGMSEAVRSRLFEPYFTTKAAGKGTGLGLSTVYGIVTQSGGTIELWTEPGRGSVFTISFPATDEEPAEGSAGEHAPRAMKGTESIFVIEDESQVRDLIVRVLEGAGYSVSAAETGQKGLELVAAAAELPPLVITDIMLPGGMSGFDLARRLRERYPGIRILAMSGYYDQIGTVEDTIRVSGAFLLKPFAPLELLSKVRELLDAS